MPYNPGIASHGGALLQQGIMQGKQNAMAIAMWLLGQNEAKKKEADFAKGFKQGMDPGLGEPIQDEPPSGMLDANGKVTTPEEKPSPFEAQGKASSALRKAGEYMGGDKHALASMNYNELKGWIAARAQKDQELKSSSERDFQQAQIGSLGAAAEASRATTAEKGREATYETAMERAMAESSPLAAYVRQAYAGGPTLEGAGMLSDLDAGRAELPAPNQNELIAAMQRNPKAAMSRTGQQALQEWMRVTTRAGKSAPQLFSVPGEAGTMEGVYQPETGAFQLNPLLKSRAPSDVQELRNKAGDLIGYNVNGAAHFLGQQDPGMARVEVDTLTGRSKWIIPATEQNQKAYPQYFPKPGKGGGSAAPAGTVLMYDKSGQQVAVPEADVKKRLSQGYKKI